MAADHLNDGFEGVDLGQLSRRLPDAQLRQDPA